MIDSHNEALKWHNILERLEAFTRYSSTSRLLCTNQSSSCCPPPTHLHCPHYYTNHCTAFAPYTTTPRPPMCIPYTIQYWHWQYRVKANLPSPIRRTRDSACFGIRTCWDAAWPLRGIATATIVWCIAYTRGVGWGSYIGHSSCNIIAIVWAMQMGRGKRRMIRSCTKALRWDSTLPDN